RRFPAMAFCPACRTLMKPVPDQGDEVCPLCDALPSIQNENSSYVPGRNGLFPFEKVRKGQEDLLKDARIALGDGRHLLANAPTGLGKTVVALTASLEVALREDKLVLFLTSKQSQHKVAIDTVLLMNKSGPRSSAVDVISKQAMCQLPEARKFSKAFYEYCNLQVRTKSCPWSVRDCGSVAEFASQKTMHVHQLVQLCRRFGVCPHKTALKAAARSHVLVCDYNYVFSDISQQVLTRVERAMGDLIVVVDEAHNLPDRIRSHLCGDLSPRRLKKAIKESRSYDKALSSMLVSILRSFLKIFKEKEGEEKAERAEFVDLVVKSIRKVSRKELTLMDLVALLEHVGEKVLKDGGSSALMEIANFLRNWNVMDDGMVRILTHGKKKKISYKLLDPSILSAPVFKEIHSSLVMSGTLHPLSMYADLLGMEKDRTSFGQYPSPFPKENRSIVVTPGLTSLYAKRGERMFKSYADSIIRIADSLPGNLAAFFPSYDFLRQVRNRMDGWKAKPILAESSSLTKEEKNAFLVKLKTFKKRGGAVLMAVLGGSLSEGVDFKNNLLHSVVVAGVPISPPTIENQALMDYYSQKFGREKGFEYSFIYPAINKVLQAAGRCIRSEKDKAVIFLMDERYAQDRYSKCLPDNYDFIVSRDVGGEVERFFSRISSRQKEIAEVQTT
ncbi:MAG: ATP-dependent DNA helicase, partial [Thermoplasmata archaeon]